MPDSRKKHWDEFAAMYCETQEQTPEGLLDMLHRVNEAFEPEGFLMAECEMMDSSYFGHRIILPFGGAATLRAPPEHYFSPRGLASDQSQVVALINADQIPWRA